MHMEYGRGWGSWSCIFQNEIPHTTLFSSLSQVLNCCIKYQIINWFAIAAPCVHSWHSIESVHIFYPLLCWFILGDLGAINWVRINSCDATLIELVSCLWLGPKNIFVFNQKPAFILFSWSSYMKKFPCNLDQLLDMSGLCRELSSRRVFSENGAHKTEEIL